jgi:hypothetical protein
VDADGGVSFVWRRRPQRNGREEVGIWGEWQRIELCFSRVIGGSVFLSILPVEASRQWSNGGLFSR